MTASFEKNSINNKASFSIGIFQDNLEESTWHYHETYEISFITEGSGKRIVADSIEEFNPGDLVFLGRDLPHVWLVDKEAVAPNKRKLEMVFLQFRSETLSAELLSLPEFKYVAKAMALSEKGIRMTGYTLNEVSEIMLQLPYLNNFERFLQFFKLMDIIGRSNELHPLASNDYVNIRSNIKNKRVAVIHEYLMKNYRDEIDLKHIASFVNMAEGSLCRFFKMNTGMTIFEYLNQIKIEFACKMLMDKNLSVLEVALDSGFNNLSHFNKQFKKITSVHPTDYRKRLLSLS